MLTPDVAHAIQQIRGTLPGLSVIVSEDGDGGARVVVEDLELGAPYKQEKTWIGFHITFPYPASDVYPHFVRGDISRIDGQSVGDAMSGGHTFLERPAVQISRKANRLDPRTDTALHKMLKVLEWLRRRP